MPRLFTGLEIPFDVAAGLASLRGGLYGARWIDEDFYHITLRFVGDVDHATACDIYDELGRVRRQPLEIALEEVATFGGDKPRAIVVKAAATRQLIELQAEQERIMRRVGLPAETRKFVPHVTLARLRGVSAMAAADYLGVRGHFRARRFIASRFVLYSSRDSVGGGPYVIEAAYPLGETDRHADYDNTLPAW